MGIRGTRMKSFRRNDRDRVKGKIVLPFYFFLFTCLCFAQTLAPGGPGKDAQWATAGKQAIGTSATRESKVWFTLAQGVMTEVYYPDVTVANVHMLQFVVVNPKTKKVVTERDDAIHQIKPLKIDSLSFQQINTAKSGEWKITKTYTTDPSGNAVLMDVMFSGGLKGYVLYVYYDPSLNNTGMGDKAWTDGEALYASEGNKTSALICELCRFGEKTSGYLGVNDGLSQLKSEAKINDVYSNASAGNVVQTARIDQSVSGDSVNTFRLVLGFGENSQAALSAANSAARKGFNSLSRSYDAGWSAHVSPLPKVDPKYQAQFNMAAMVLKAQEDKTVPGANVASLTVPWGGGANANEDVGGGYHLVWSRDLYHVFTAYMAIGDRGAAERALDFLFKIQQKEDGSFPQNSWLDGKRGWGSLQMDGSVTR